MKILFCLLTILCFTGCKSPNQINMLPAYSYEGVYEHDVPIVINGVDINRSNDKERIWIMSDKTLGYILFDAKHHYYKNTK